MNTMHSINGGATSGNNNQNRYNNIKKTLFHKNYLFSFPNMEHQTQLDSLNIIIYIISANNLA